MPSELSRPSPEAVSRRPRGRAAKAAPSPTKSSLNSPPNSWYLERESRCTVTPPPLGVLVAVVTETPSSVVHVSTGTSGITVDSEWATCRLSESEN
ncbi:MAG: hypothetical protein MHM6MM_009446 [Cercozoa sp. M6MM]